MKHIKIQPFITEEEKIELLKLANGEFINHSSTKSKRITNLNFQVIEFRGIDRVALMKMHPNKIEDWHFDGPRDCILIHPLTDNYAPCETEEGNIYGPCIIDVKNLKHAVFNNDETRINLQINCQMNFTPDLNAYKHLGLELKHDMASEL